MARWKQSWSDDDIKKLRALAGTMPVTMIAKELGRTTGTVLAKAVEQNISIMHRTDEVG
ncbi:hypothetical protein [Bradyrhizobium glycinis]|uniref:hypothetical protein n=1 Tax=Bradyrhizobium glycinis TaxID=2751812 RepID=UPI0018D80734|nr:hypothetical protein [Bradyrhizobium glycinis]MBH5373108.1 hypothetical protein [Bradyrhizobium glycinis]